MSAHTPGRQRAGRPDKIPESERNPAPPYKKLITRCLQRLLTSALVTVLLLSGLSIYGCGGGGENPVAPTAPAGTGQTAKTCYLTVTSDDYPLATPTFYYSTFNESFWSIQANIARYVQDIETRCIIRIDVPSINGTWPRLNKIFSIEDSSIYEKFPGTILVFNGSPATMSRVEQGTITFSSDSVTSEQVSGSFDITMTDYATEALPLHQHHLRGVFSFRMGEYRPA